MAASDRPDEPIQEPPVTDKLTRFANVIGGVFFGLLITGALLWFLAAGMQLAGGGIWYALIFILTTGFGYRGTKQLTEDYPAIRLPIVVVGLGAIALACANWRYLGFEDPFVAPLIFAVFLMLGYFFTGGTPGAAKSWKSQMEEQLAEAEVKAEAPAIAEEAPAISGEAPAMSDVTPATVTLYRKSNMLGMEVTYYISCDGKPVAKVEDGCRATVNIPAGDHEFTLCDEYSKGSTAPIKLTLKAGEEVFIDCSFRSIWSGVAFKTAQPADAQRDMVGLNSAA